MTVVAEIEKGQLADLLARVLAGDEVVLTQDNKPVAKLVPAASEHRHAAPLRLRSFEGRRVLTPAISQQDLAEEMFGRQ